MRRYIYVVLAILLVLAGCANENLPGPSPAPGPILEPVPAPAPSQGPVEPPPEPPDFYDVLYGRNARIVASFDLEGFSVWFAITPLWDGENSRWDFANGGNAGIPLTVAVVRESAGRYGLVEELEADLDLRLEEWDFAEMPEEVPQMRNRHLRSVGGYGFTNFFNTGIFSGNENVRRQALVVAYACDKDSGFAVYRPQAS